MQTWFDTIEKIFDKATLLVPSRQPFQTGGLKGNHTEHLGFILAEMQWLQRVYPNSNW